MKLRWLALCVLFSLYNCSDGTSTDTGTSSSDSLASIDNIGDVYEDPMTSKEREICQANIDGINFNKKLSPKLVTDTTNECYVDYGLSDSELGKIKGVRHFFADIVEYQSSADYDPVASLKEVMRRNKEVVINLFKYKYLFAKSTTDFRSILLDAMEEDSVSDALYDFVKDEIDSLLDEGALDIFVAFFGQDAVDDFVDSETLLDLVAELGAGVDDDYRAAELDADEETIAFFEDNEEIISALYDFVLLGEPLATLSSESDAYTKLRTVTALLGAPDISAAYEAVSTSITEAINDFDIGSIIKKEMSAFTDIDATEGKELIEFAVDLIENYYYQRMTGTDKKRLLASIVRQTIPMALPAESDSESAFTAYLRANRTEDDRMDQIPHLLTGLVNGSGTYLQKLIQKFTNFIPQVDIENRCMAVALQGAKSQLSENPEFATLANHAHIAESGGKIVDYAYIGKASVGVAMMALYENPDGEASCIAYKELRWEVAERLEREVDVINEVAEKHNFTAFVSSMGDRIEEEMNLGGDGGEVDNLQLAHTAYFMADDVGAQDYNGTIVPVDMIEDFPRDREYMAMALAPGFEFGDIVEIYQAAIDKHKGDLDAILDYIKVEQNSLRARSGLDSLQTYDVTDLKIDLYSQIYLVHNLVNFWVDKAFFGQTSEGMFHSDLHEGNMFMSVDTAAIREKLGSEAANVTYEMIEELAEEKSAGGLDELSMINLTMIDFGAWEVMRQTTGYGIINLATAGILGSPEGFFQSLESLTEQFQDDITDKELLLDTVTGWVTAYTNPDFVTDATDLITRKYSEDGVTVEDASSKLNKLLMVKMTMEHNVIPPKQVIGFLEGFVALTGSTIGFTNVLNSLNSEGLGFTWEEITEADGITTLGMTMLSALLDDLLGNLFEGEPGESLLTEQGVELLGAAIGDLLLLPVNVVRQDSFVLEQLRTADISFINSGNRTTAVNDIGMKFLKSITFRPSKALTCAEGEENDAALCYPPCDEGYTGVGPLCWQDCPDGYTDMGVSCTKPAAYGRGLGYPWEFGDAAFSLDGAWARCRAENSQGCEQSGAIIYPKCKEGFYAFGSNICTPDCINDMRDDGAFCAKSTYGRGAGGVIHDCGNWNEKDSNDNYIYEGAPYTQIEGLCYASCNSASNRTSFFERLEGVYSDNGWADEFSEVQNETVVNLSIFCGLQPTRIKNVIGIKLPTTALVDAEDVKK